MLLNESLFKSRDFYSCAALRASGFVLKAIEPMPSGKFAVFVFEDPEGKAQEVVKKHWSGGLELKTIDFVSAVNELKSRLNDGI